MPRSSTWDLLLKILGVIAVLGLAGIVLKLLQGALQSLLPASAMTMLTDGWNQVYTAISPALPSIGALLVLALIVWVILGRR
ncbi:hypothetical protein D0T12_18485 [Actinomadura spongiicola]|uniref:Uncharacterized protein n=1 Tax=Actinomadura spongiicola TaxID=2303421 RepID=A0A372GFH3_9ACTN|nr:hypothetical protein [Actinomadura spongiicola]RFS84146.1 hypothetical protein D0T12_18485 [Actinomadura spongiicola]